MSVAVVIEVSTTCAESFPCQHHVRFVDAHGKIDSKSFYGDQIKLFLMDGRWQPMDKTRADHFKCY